MASRDRLPRFTEEPELTPVRSLRDSLRRVGTWMMGLTMAAGFLTLGFLLGSR
jgi:hypothetical protein